MTHTRDATAPIHSVLLSALLSLLVTLLVAGCASSPTSPAPGLAAEADATESATCEPAYDVEFTPGTTFEAVEDDATAPWPSPGVSFEATVTRVGAAVHVDGILRNANPTAVSVDYLTGGVIGVATNPFQVDIDVQPATPLGPEVYPAPHRANLPPGGTITYRVVRCPPFPAHVRWAFSPWHGVAVQGATQLP